MTEVGREGLSVSCLRFGLQPGPGALPFREMHKKKGLHGCLRLCRSGRCIKRRGLHGRLRLCRSGRADVHKKRAGPLSRPAPLYILEYSFFGIFICFLRIFNCTQTQYVLRGGERSPKQRPSLLRPAGVKAEDTQSDEKQTNQSGADGLLCLSDQRYIFHQGITALFQIEIYIVLTFELIIKDLSKFYEIKSSVSDEKFPDNRSCAGTNVYLDMMIGCIFHNIKHFSTSFLNHEVL